MIFLKFADSQNWRMGDRREKYLMLQITFGEAILFLFAELGEKEGAFYLELGGR